ncbi:Uncharacterized protein dnm_035310 [Desulfonema magnum]|uniref:Uncharacterized protein n=1 Tax=Desulfonema magnum TaxID=45655 RepID=A0A975BLJ4_9BACT|nr:Uncharacterized protein dnm_035310 [Desulfonema magnum]
MKGVAVKYPIKSFLYFFFFCEQRRNPGFSLRVSKAFRKKAGFLPRANIENLWLATY